MEQTKTKKKSKSFIVMLVAILLCIAVVLGMGGFTYAKYVSSKTVDTQSATVAKWGYVIGADTSELFGKGYASNKVNASVTASNADVFTTGESNVVAPGTSGYMTFSITGTAEVRSQVSASVESTSATIKLTGTDGTSYEPILWTLSKENSNGSYDNVTDAVNVSFETVSSKINELSETINPTETPSFSYKLSWSWALDNASDGVKESNADLYDTILGAMTAYDSTNFTTAYGPKEEKIDLTGTTGASITTTSGDTSTTVTYTGVTTLQLDLKITVTQVQGTNA